MSAHAAHSPAPAGTTTGRTTPKVKNSMAWKLIIGLVVVIIIGIIATVSYYKKPSNYNMLNVDYGSVLEITLNPGKSARIALTNDFLTAYSEDGPVCIYGDKGNNVPLIIDGHQILQGSGNTIVQSDVIRVTNRNKNSITFKMGRCKSKEACTITF